MSRKIVIFSFYLAWFLLPQLLPVFFSFLLCFILHFPCYYAYFSSSTPLSIFPFFHPFIPHFLVPLVHPTFLRFSPSFNWDTACWRYTHACFKPLCRVSLQPYCSSISEGKKCFNIGDFAESLFLSARYICLAIFTPLLLKHETKYRTFLPYCRKITTSAFSFAPCTWSISSPTNCLAFCRQNTLTARTYSWEYEMKFCKRQGAVLILTWATKMTSCHGKVGLTAPAPSWFSAAEIVGRAVGGRGYSQKRISEESLNTGRWQTIIEIEQESYNQLFCIVVKCRLLLWALNINWKLLNTFTYFTQVIFHMRNRIIDLQKLQYLAEQNYRRE